MKEVEEAELRSRRLLWRRRRQRRARGPRGERALRGGGEQRQSRGSSAQLSSASACASFRGSPFSACWRRRPSELTLCLHHVRAGELRVAPGVTPQPCLHSPHPLPSHAACTLVSQQPLLTTQRPTPPRCQNDAELDRLPGRRHSCQLGMWSTSTVGAELKPEGAGSCCSRGSASLDLAESLPLTPSSALPLAEAPTSLLARSVCLMLWNVRAMSAFAR